MIELHCPPPTITLTYLQYPHHSSYLFGRRNASACLMNAERQARQPLVPFLRLWYDTGSNLRPPTPEADALTITLSGPGHLWAECLGLTCFQSQCQATRMLVSCPLSLIDRKIFFKRSTNQTRKDHIKNDRIGRNDQGPKRLVFVSVSSRTVAGTLNDVSTFHETSVSK